MQVAVGVLQRGDGRVLVARRDASRHQGGGLEFPGGKVERGESIECALERELVEELGIRPVTSSPLMTIRHRYSDRAVVLHARRVTHWSGQPRAASPEDCAWRHAADLDHWDFPAANRPLLAALRWPACSPVTPPLETVAASGWQQALETMLSQSEARLLRLRLSGHGDAGASSLGWLREVAPGDPATRLLVNAPPEQVEAMPAWVGLHLPARQAGEWDVRPVSQQRLFSCACHDEHELERAESLGADLAYLGPVKATPSHPDAAGLGWSGLRALAERSVMPLYAIGGLAPSELADARASGAVGVAGIRGFWPSAEARKGGA